MAPSPSRQGSTVVGVTIESDGRAIPDTIAVISATVDLGVNRIPRAALVLEDGDMPGGDFPVSSSGTFAPGASIRISAGYDGQEALLFEGIVVKHGIAMSGSNVSSLVVECRDAAVAMTLGRRNRHFGKGTVSDAIGALIGEYGLTARVDRTSGEFTELVQYDCSDWDYLVSAAEASGLLAIVEGGEVSVAAPDTHGRPVLTVTWGADLVEFEAEMDARWQPSSSLGASWDPVTQSLVTRTSPPVDLGLQGNVTSKALAQAVGANRPDTLQTAVPLAPSEVDGWARARMTRAALARVRGRMTFEGSALARPGALIELAGVGSRFEGNVWVSSVLHEISGGSWTTEVEFGLDPFAFSERKDLMAPPAAGRTAGVSGLQIGVVKALEGHPAGEPMVQVTLMAPTLSGEEGVWARLAAFYASNTFGAFFLPEIGDEVVLGFLSDDPTHPVVLGSLHSSKRATPYPLADTNHPKALVTREKLRIEFDDEKKVLTLETPGGNRVVLSDEAKSIRLEDQSGNVVEMAEGGITLTTPKDLVLEAGGKVSAKAGSTLELEATADLKAQGMNVTCKGSSAFTGQGGSSATLEGGGQAVVKGALVMIN
jgi:Rhs element Vgr protein